MKRGIRILSAVLTAVIFFLTPAANLIAPHSAAVVSAHGHGGGHHGSGQSVSTEYYYCHGHDAHTHDNGICPYYGDHCSDTYSSGSGSTAFSQGCFSHMYSGNGHRQHCRFLIPTATGISLL